MPFKPFLSLCISVISIALFSVASCNKYDTEITGNVTVAQLFEAPYKGWFESNYLNYNVKNGYDINNEDIHIEVYFASWCWMSRKYLPEFIKVAQMYQLKFTVFELDENKQSEEGFEVGKNIEFVPTFVVYRNNLEIGRIVEQSDNFESALELLTQP